MFKVVDEASNEVFTVYDVIVDVFGDTKFLVYGFHGYAHKWRYVYAIYFKPYEEDK